MKQLFSIVLILITIIYAGEVYAWNDGASIIQLEKYDNETDEEPIPSKGRRSLAKPFYCIIDPSVPSLETNIPSAIINYEIWDENGQCNIACFCTDEDFISYFTTLNGCYQLRLITQDCVYIGYLNL